MSRGWESKSVEAQQEEHERKARPANLTAEQRAKAARRQTLLLQRAKAQADLARATRPGHRSMLERALDEIGEELRKLE
jgi:hypothetical protein